MVTGNEEGHLTRTLVFAIIVAAFGSSFQHGYNVGVLNQPEAVVEDWIGSVINGSRDGSSYAKPSEVTFIYATIVSIYCIGGMTGALITNMWSNLFGRKWGIFANNSFIFIAALLMSLAKPFASYIMLIIGRFVVGINSGLNAGLVPMYLSEIPPIRFRGGVGSVYQLCLTISILISQMLGVFLGTETTWPYLMIVGVIPAVIQIVLLPLCADSPTYLQIQNEEEATKKALMWFRRTENVESELNILRSEVQAQQEIGTASLKDMFTNPVLRKPLIISCMVMLAQQLSGINAVIFYSTSTFRAAGMSHSTAVTGTLFIGALNVVMTVVSTIIVDKVGRKTLLEIGFGAMFVDTIILCLCLVTARRTGSILFMYMSIFSMVLFVVLFAIGAGSIPWFLVSELFLANARQKAVGIAVAVNWTANFIVGISFPGLQHMLGPYVFMIFAGFQLIFFVYILVQVPETKNRTIEEITSEFMSKTE